MEIRLPNQLEMKQIQRLTSQAIYEGTMGETKPNLEKAKEIVASLLKKGCSYFVAVEDQQVLGWILTGISRDSFTEQSAGFISELFVKEEFRGKGMAKELMLYAKHSLKEEGLTEIRLNVYEGNPAIRLYEKLGFQVRSVSMALKLE